MQKTPFQNFSPFSHSFKMFECMSIQQNSENMKHQTILPWHGLRIRLAFPSHLIFWCEIFCKTLLGTLQNYKNTPGFNTMHSWPKKTKNRSFGKNTECNGIWAVLRIPKHAIPLDFSKYQENDLTFLNGFFFFLPSVSHFRDHIWPRLGHLTLNRGHRGSQCIHGAFLLRLCVYYND